MKKLLLSFAILSIAFGNAQNIFQDNFNSYTTGVQLSGQGIWSNQTSGGGLGSCVGGGCTNSMVLPISMSYVGWGTSTNSLEVRPNLDGNGRIFTAVTSGDLYVGFLINLSNAQANNNSDFFRVMNLSNATTTYRLYVTPTTGGFFVGAAKGANGNPISFTTNSYVYNQDHLIIVKYSQGTGTSDDIVSLYVDPIYNNGVPGSADATVTSGLDQAGNVDRLAFRQNWTNGMPTGIVGMPSVALTWETLTFNLSNDQFNKNTFVITSNEIKNGLLSIKSNIEVEKAILKIYDLQGRTIETQILNIAEQINDVAVNPILNTGIYVIEIKGDNNVRFTQKISVN